MTGNGYTVETRERLNAAALRSAVAAGEYSAHLHRQRLEAVATIINDFMNKLREAIELLEKELL